MSRVCRARREKLQFFSVKSKLESLTKSTELAAVFEREAILAHLATKRATSFFKLFSLRSGEMPDVDHSTAIKVFNCVCSRSSRGKKPMAGPLDSEMERFWNDEFSAIHPTKVDLNGRSFLKQILADSMVTCTRSRLFFYFYF